VLRERPRARPRPRVAGHDAERPSAGGRKLRVPRGACAPSAPRAFLLCAPPTEVAESRGLSTAPCSTLPLLCGLRATLRPAVTAVIFCVVFHLAAMRASFVAELPIGSTCLRSKAHVRSTRRFNAPRTHGKMRETSSRRPAVGSNTFGMNPPRAWPMRGENGDAATQPEAKM